MNYIEKIHDITTGEITEVPYTDEQIKEAKASEKEAKLNAEKIADELETKNAEKQAIADRLGITLDELKLLLG